MSICPNTAIPIPRSTTAPARASGRATDDGDGVREVHCNTIEGLWTGVRNFPRIFRGVNKVYLQQYIAIFEWTHNFKKVTKEFLRNVLTCKAPAPVKGPTT